MDSLRVVLDNYTNTYFIERKELFCLFWSRWVRLDEHGLSTCNDDEDSWPMVYENREKAIESMEEFARSKRVPPRFRTVAWTKEEY